MTPARQRAMALALIAAVTSAFLLGFAVGYMTAPSDAPEDDSDYEPDRECGADQPPDPAMPGCDDETDPEPIEPRTERE